MNQSDTPPQPKSDIVLTEEQQEAITLITSWLDKGDKQEFKLGGYAGTGKTTLVKYLKKSLEEDALSTTISAFTGKACHVLSKKGLPAQTLHSLLYNVIPIPKGQVKFELKSHLEFKPTLFIVDEASMISSELYKDLKSFGIPILFIGDPGQLEPVGDNPNLMREPDFILTKILRQAADNPIISFATHVREGGPLIPQVNEGLTIKSKYGFGTTQAFLVDQCICAKNKTRVHMNTTMRAAKRLPVGEITLNEKLICLRNNTQYNVFNGQIFWVSKIKTSFSQTWTCNLVDELGKEKFDIPVWKLPFTAPVDKDTPIPKDVVYCDYGYVITCHKSQGSEWDSILVFDEWMPPQVWDMKRWRYTAITRAAKQLTYLI